MYLRSPRKKRRTFRFISLVLAIGLYFAIFYKYPPYPKYNTSKTSLIRENINTEFKRYSKFNQISDIKSISIKTPNSEITNYITDAVTIQEVLNDIGIEVKNSYVLNLPINSTIINKSHIKIDEIVSKVITETESIEYSIEEIEDTSMFIDESRIVQNGITGEKKLQYKITYKNGIQTQKELIEEEITNQPQNKIIAVGTKPKQETIEGNLLTYTQKITMYATSYDGNCFGCTGRTYTGTSVTKGVVAVDPNIIPLYTKLYIPGYGFAQALDIGGGVRGNMIDLGFANLAEVQGAWSARYTDVYVLK